MYYYTCVYVLYIDCVVTYGCIGAAYTALQMECCVHTHSESAGG